MEQTVCLPTLLGTKEASTFSIYTGSGSAPSFMLRVAGSLG